MDGTPGNGLLLFFCVSDFDEALGRARKLAAPFIEEPQTNKNTRAMEFSVRNPDGYYVTVSAFRGWPQTGQNDPLPRPEAGEFSASES